jgi:hypothetical protein
MDYKVCFPSMNNKLLFFQGASDEDWYVKLSYGPRWIIYIIGSGYFNGHAYHFYSTEKENPHLYISWHSTRRCDDCPTLVSLEIV